VSATRASGGSTVDGGPLAGVRVVVTRAAHQARSTVAAFEDAGARVALLPLLEVVPPEDPGPLDAALAQLDHFGWIAFTSSNAVAALFDRCPRLPETVRLASVGGATSDALRERGVAASRIEVEADESRAEGLAEALLPRLTSTGGATGRGARVLLPQAADARPALEDALRAGGAEPLRVDAYAKRVPPDARARALEIFGARHPGRFGWVTFTSPSIARAFSELWGDWPSRRRGLFAASIGPVTSAALRELGVEPAAEAESPGDHGMVAAVVDAVSGRGLGRA
jgi:uroporphyrinogen-III synthase